MRKCEDVLSDLIGLGFKQSFLEDYCNLPKGKITEILKGRAVITFKFANLIEDGINRLKEEFNSMDLEVQEASEKSKQYCVYVHIFPDDKKYYGISCSPLERWKKDGSGYINQTDMWKAIQEVGWENIQHQILHSDLTKEAALIIEKTLIETYKTYIPSLGYNKYI